MGIHDYVPLLIQGRKATVRSVVKRNFLTWAVRVIVVMTWVTPCAAWAGEKVLSELDPTKNTALTGWQFDTAGVTVANGAIRIASLSGVGQEWASQWIRYAGSFSVEDATVQLECTADSITPYRELYLALIAAKSHQYTEPAVSVRITNGIDHGEILVEQHRNGSVERVVPINRIPFAMTGRVQTTFTLTNGNGMIEVRNGTRTHSLNLGRLIGPKWRVYPFTVLAGSMQHGSASEPAVVTLSHVKLISTNANEVAVAEFIGNTAGKDDRVTYIDLYPYANRRFEDQTTDDKTGGWTDQGANDLRFIPKGYQFFRNVPFYIVDRVAVVGNAPEPGCIMLKSSTSPNLPMESKPIVMNATAKYCYFLQTCSYGVPGNHCADYDVQYDDGSHEQIPLRVGRELGDWWGPKDLASAMVAWRGKNAVTNDVGFHLFAWANPHPEKKIASIIFRSRNTITSPALIALTASPEKIAIGPLPRVFRDQVIDVCEYRQRIKTAYVFASGPKNITVTRSIPIADESQVRQARIDVIRYRADVPTTVSCMIGAETQTEKLKVGQLRAQLLFTQAGTLQFLTQHKAKFDIRVQLDDPQGVGSYRYETNPNHAFTPAGEDFAHGMHAISGVFMVTPFQPEHRVSGYIEYLDKPVTSRPVERQTVALTADQAKIDWLGAKLCLSSLWQWQPGGPKGFEGTESNIPAAGWKNIAVPCDVGTDIFKIDPNLISAWFKKDIEVPAEWAGRRLTLHFMGVSEFATVFCNNQKVAYHEGLNAFDIDITDTTKPGQRNTVVVFVSNVYKGIVLSPLREKLKLRLPAITPYKGHAYRLDGYLRGAWDQNPDEIELLLDGNNVARRAGSIDEVVAKGDGLYYREQFWNTCTLYFSLPGNQQLESLVDHLVLVSNQPGVFNHFGRSEPGHHWTHPQSRATGINRDVFLVVSGKPHIEDVFIKPSVRKMALTADVTVADVPTGATLSASVRDGANTVLDLGSRPVKAGESTVSLSHAWANPIFWEPGNPHLYHLQVEIKNSAGTVVDRRFERFGFREFWIDGVYFKFNGKTIYLQNAALIAVSALPLHRQHLRKLYQDLNQQGNINIIRWHIGGMLYPETAEVADEMGMLLQPESMFGIGLRTYIQIIGDNDTSGLAHIDDTFKWHTDAVKLMRNSPAVVSWSAENEHLMQMNAADVTAAKPIIDTVLRLNAAIKAADPTRPVVDNGATAQTFFNYWKDPRIDIIDGHYIPSSIFANWQKRFGKPCCTGEESLGGDFAWGYQGEIRSRMDAKADYIGYFYGAVNAANAYIIDKIKMWKGMKLSSICPFAFDKRFNPALPPWSGAMYGSPTAPVPWPAMSGENIKPELYGYDYGQQVNFFDPAVPLTYLRTWNGVRDSFDEVPKLQPRFSPEIIIEVADTAGHPVADQLVWLLPSGQPGSPIGLHTDANGRAWFWCKSGAGTYRLAMTAAGNSWTANVTPVPAGEWMQIRTMRVTWSK